MPDTTQPPKKAGRPPNLVHEVRGVSIKVARMGTRSLIAPNGRYQFFLTHRRIQGTYNGDPYYENEDRDVLLQGTHYKDKEKYEDLGDLAQPGFMRQQFATVGIDPKTKQVLIGCGFMLSQDAAIDLGYEDRHDKEGDLVATAFEQIQRAVLSLSNYGRKFVFADGDDHYFEEMIPQFKTLIRRQLQMRDIKPEWMAFMSQFQSEDD